MTNILTRKGKIEISHDVIQDEPELVQAVLNGALIVRAESHVMTNSIHYDLYHPEFREVEAGELVPHYDVQIETDDDTGELKGIEFIERGSQNGSI